MTTSTLSNMIIGTDGIGLEGLMVEARLRPGPGFRILDGAEVSTTGEAFTDSFGGWSMVLERNIDIFPAMTYYEIEEHIPSAEGGRRLWTVYLETSGSLYSSVVSTLMPSYEQLWRPVGDESDLDGIYVRIDDIDAMIAEQVDAAMVAHLAELNPHPVYATGTDINTAINLHEAETDPHATAKYAIVTADGRKTWAQQTMPTLAGGAVAGDRWRKSA